jgi:polyisoprenoid-binding protein YceI
MIGRRGFLLSSALLLAERAAAAESLYAIDPRFGSIEFTVNHMGLFTSRGWFRRFSAMIALDPARPARTRISAEVDANSLDMRWQEAATMLRSPDFFDVARFPRIGFRSTDVSVLAPDRYAVRGVLDLRGVSRPLTLSATLLERQAEQGTADFDVKGKLSRSAFGMVADHLLIADEVRIAIRARIRLASS